MRKKDQKKFDTQCKQYIKDVNKFVNQVHDWGFAQKFGITKLPEGDDASDESNESGSGESSSNVKSYLKLIDKKIKLAQMF